MTEEIKEKIKSFPLRRRLLILAEIGDHEESNRAMEILRKRYDSTYFWCKNCEGLVTTKSECCLTSIKQK